MDGHTIEDTDQPKAEPSQAEKNIASYAKSYELCRASALQILTGHNDYNIERIDRLTELFFNRFWDDQQAAIDRKEVERIKMRRFGGVAQI